MRKFGAIALCLIAVFTLQCKKEETATDTAATDTAVSNINAGDTAGTAATFNERGVAATSVTVVFEGMITHVLDGGVMRAIIPRIEDKNDPSKTHPRTLIMPISVKEDFEAAFGTTCSGSCSAVIDGHAFRIVDKDGNPSRLEFDPTFAFRNFVTKLSTIPDTPFASSNNFLRAVFAPGPPAIGSLVAGFFELAGGKGYAVPFNCGAQFEGQTSFAFFAKSVEVVFPDGAILQVLKYPVSDWTKAANIKLPAGKSFTVDNDLKHSKMSHFGKYIVLKDPSSGGPASLRDVIVEGGTESDCNFLGYGGRPGCSNSQFP